MNRQCLLQFCLYLFIVFMTLASFDTLNADDRSTEKQTEPREPGEISRDQTALVRLTSKKVDEAKRVKAIVGLCKLFVEIGEHPEIDKSATLQRVSVELQTRLRGIEDRLISELRQRNIPEPDSMIEAERAKRKAKSSRRMLPASEPTSESTLAVSATASATASENSSSSSSEPRAKSQSPGTTTNQTGLSGPGIDDMGWWLVDLIRHTVQPAYWDTAGGPGTVVYYGPSRALVIRGNWRIHEAVADMLSALR